MARTHDQLGRTVCTDCGRPTHTDACDPHDIVVEVIRRIVAAGIAQRRDATTIARLAAEALAVVDLDRR